MKKKIFAILTVALVVLLAFAGCEQKKPGVEAVQNIVKTPSEWIVGEDVDFDDCSYAVTDLDQNGKPEIIVNYSDNANNITPTRIYVTDSSDNLVETERKAAGKVFESAYFDEVINYGRECFYDAESKIYYYTYTKTTRTSKREQYRQIISFSLNGEVVTEELLATEIETYNDEIEDLEYTYTDGEGNTIDKDGFDNAAVNRYKDLQQKKVTFGGFRGFTYAENKNLKNMSKGELEDILSKSLSKFVIS